MGIDSPSRKFVCPRLTWVDRIDTPTAWHSGRTPVASSNLVCATFKSNNYVRTYLVGVSRITGMEMGTDEPAPGDSRPLNFNFRIDTGPVLPVFHSASSVREYIFNRDGEIHFSPRVTIFSPIVLNNTIRANP